MLRLLIKGSLSMKLLRNLFIIVIGCVISNVALAKNSKYESALLPGTHVVAGDPQKNEFFIVAKNEISRVKTASQIVPTIKTALNTAFRTKQMMGGKKSISKIEIRQVRDNTKNKAHQVIDEKKLAQVEVVPHWMVHNEMKEHSHSTTKTAKNKVALKDTNKSAKKALA